MQIRATHKFSLFLILTFLFLVRPIIGQPIHKGINLKTPQYYKIDPKYDKEDAVVMFDNQWVDIYRETGKYEVTYRFYKTKHKVVRVFTDEGIEMYNKVYIPMTNVKKMLRLEVRSVAPDGKVTFLNSENMKELKNVEGYGNYKIFAIEGIQKGSQIEYIYSLETKMPSTGRIHFQSKVPTMHKKFVFRCTHDIGYSFKSYNGLSNGTAEQGKYYLLYELTESDIPAVKEEQNAANKRNEMYMDYKLIVVYDRHDYYTWKKICKNLVNNNVDGSSTGKAKKVLKEQGITGTGLSKEAQVIKMEEYVKSNFQVKNSSKDIYTYYRDVMDRKVGNSQGISKVYLKFLEALQVEYQLCFAPSRYDGKLDSSFSSYSDLDYYQIYLPELDKYITPTASGLRLGPAFYNIAGGKGLFIKMAYKNSGGLRYDGFEIKPIKSLTAKDNQFHLTANIKLDTELSQLNVTQKNVVKGYRAIENRHEFSTKKDEESYIKEFEVKGIKEFELVNSKRTNEALSINSDLTKPLISELEYNTDFPVQKAGNDYVISIGKFAGDFYKYSNDSARQQDIEIGYSDEYFITITLEIPEGYSCDAKTGNVKTLSYSMPGEEQPALRFIYDIVQTDATHITFKMNEFYNEFHYPASMFEDVKSVTNGAYDFNQLKIVLSPNK